MEHSPAPLPLPQHSPWLLCFPLPARFQLFLDPAGLWWAASGSSTPATQHLGIKGWGPAVRSPLKMAHRPRGEVLLEYAFLRGRDFWLFSSLLTPQSLE